MWLLDNHLPNTVWWIHVVLARVIGTNRIEGDFMYDTDNSFVCTLDMAYLFMDKTMVG